MNRQERDFFNREVAEVVRDLIGVKGAIGLDNLCISQTQKYAEIISETIVRNKAKYDSFDDIYEDFNKILEGINALHERIISANKDVEIRFESDGSLLVIMTNPIYNISTTASYSELNLPANW